VGRDQGRGWRRLLAAQERIMQITKNSVKTNPGPSAWFTGSVYIDTVAVPSEEG